MDINSHTNFPHLYSVLEEALPEKFSRQGRKLNPAKVMGLLCVMCTLGQKGYRRVIREMRGGLRRAFGWDADEDVPTPQAFGQARQALTPEICLQAFDAVQAACIASNNASARGYAGLREVGMDGTRLPLPVDPTLIEHFGCPSNGDGATQAPMAGLVQLWDLAANRPIAFSLARCDFSERAEALDLFRHLGSGDLLIGDRGYPCFEIFQRLQHKDVRFILRCSVTLNAAVRTFMKGGSTDEIVTVKPPPKFAQEEPLSLRLMKVQLPSGKVEVLATNLLTHEGHTAEKLSELYLKRWRVETAFREMKVWHAVEAFSARFVAGIEQELMALQIFMLLASELEARAQEELDQRRTHAETEEERQNLTLVQFNRLLIADAAVELTRVAIDQLDSIPEIVASNLKYLWKQRSKKRPGRSFPRNKKSAPRGFKKKA